ncbi:MAG TPA: hypothetical protein VN157_07380, partial [Caulobacter sp.]|nr:hypothetical protein [Caulobacter sp.]
MNVHIPTFPLHDADDLASNFQELPQKILRRQAVIGVVGPGYVGVPLSEAFCTAGFRVIGFDLDDVRLASLREGASYLSHFANTRVAAKCEQGFAATSAPEVLARADAVPTPITVTIPASDIRT